MWMLAACVAQDTGEGPKLQACSSDETCAPAGICEEAVCVDGDRNNDISEAEALLAEQPAEGVLNPAGDVDYYAFSAEQGSFVRARTVLTAEDTTVGYDTVLILRDPSGNIVMTADGYPTGGTISNADAVVYAYLADAGIYTLAVQDAADYAGTGATGAPGYTYAVDVEGWTQHTEEGGSYDIAPTTPDTWSAIGVLIDEEGDTDQLRVTFPWDDATLTVAGGTNLGNSAATPVVELRGGDGGTLSRLSNVGPGGMAFHPSLDAGDYTIVLSDTGGGGNDHWYFVFLEIGAEGGANPEEAEDNDTRGAANALDFTEKTTGSGELYSYAYVWGDADGGGDDDWFSIGVPYDPAYIVVCAEGPTYGAGVPATLDVYDEAGVRLGGSDEFAGGPDARVENLVPGGPATLRVTSAASDANGWYDAVVYVASFPVDPWEDGGYVCPGPG